MPDKESAVSRILSEDVLTLEQACDELARITGQKPCRQTLTRWVHRGAGGVRLDGVRIGNQILTSKQALNRFFVARTANTIGNS
jgi:hypothetical protein